MPAPAGYTFRQYQLANFIEAYVKEHGFSPSFDEMRAALGLRSKSGIARLIDGLVERGRLTRAKNRARSVTICSVSRESAGVAA